MNYGLFRVACASPYVTVADCKKNTIEIEKYIRKAEQDSVSLIVFPELSITGYTCADLFLQQNLQNSAIKELCLLCDRTKDIPVMFAVGLPVAYKQSLFNCAAIVYKGSILALIPKTHIPEYGEFYEKRQFTSFSDIAKSKRISISFDDVHKNIPLDTKILFSDETNSNIFIAVEICEDLWVPYPPSTSHAQAGANIILNLSASNEVVGKSAYRETLVSSQSGRLSCAYIYADAGNGESTTDMVFAADNIIAENGTILNRSNLFTEGYLVQDIDLERLIANRRHQSTFTPGNDDDYLIINLTFPDFNVEKVEIKRDISSYPFVPTDIESRTQRCAEIISMQAEGLAKRIKHTNVKKAIIGLSGGLDSTLAFLITTEAFKRCNLDYSGIVAVTMPGYGTTDRTYFNALSLAQAFNTTLTEIPIAKAVDLHFKDIGHDKSIHNITYENSQARERTQILMDLANKENGLVIGTGDLSELALGWATYNGDHMSMYGVNSSIPKTLVRYLVTWFADSANSDNNKKLSTVLFDILDTPVSPELLPPTEGQISQKTEEIVGPYSLHDFFLYYFLRWGFRPEKVYFLAKKAFNGVYTPEIILKWLRVFIKRFFSQQFKRSCMPDGAKVGTVSLSPRGDWRMPSDASSAGWLKELEKY